MVLVGHILQIVVVEVAAVVGRTVLVPVDFVEHTVRAMQVDKSEFVAKRKNATMRANVCINVPVAVGHIVVVAERIELALAVLVVVGRIEFEHFVVVVVRIVVVVVVAVHKLRVAVEVAVERIASAVDLVGHIALGAVRIVLVAEVVVVRR